MNGATMQLTENTTCEGRILVVVICCHLALLLLLAVGSLLQPRRPPLPDAIKVGLVSLPAPPEPKPVAPKPSPPSPDPTPEPPPPPPRDAPKPAPQPKPRIAPQPKPRIVPKPKPRTVVKIPLAKPPPKKKWKANSADDIRKRLAVRQPRPTASRPSVAVDPNAIAKRIKASVPLINVSAPAISRPASGRQPRLVQRYYDAVGAELYRLWSQPSRAEAPGNPRVTVAIVVSRNGTVQSRRMVTPSSVAAMNSTVSRALYALKRLPDLAGFGIDRDSLEIRVDFELTE